MNINKMDQKIEDSLDLLRLVPPRDIGAAARGKTDFLRQASLMRAAVSWKQETRHNGWITSIFPVFPRKERSLMFKITLAMVLVIGMVFGGSAITAYAAQDSLPDQATYQIKTWSEDAFLALAGSPEARLKFDLDFSDRRISEMAGLLSAGRPIPETAMERLQNELQQALELAAGMGDPQMVQQLNQIRLRAENQLQRLNALISGLAKSTQPVLIQAQARIREQIRLCELGLTDPQGFRLQVQQRHKNRDGSQPPTRIPVPAGNLHGPGPMNTPQNPVVTPMPHGNGFGPSETQPTWTPRQNGPGHQSPYQTPQTWEGTQGIATREPAKTPMPNAGTNRPSQGANPPTGTPGKNGAGPQSPNTTPQPGNDSGNGSR